MVEKGEKNAPKSLKQMMAFGKHRNKRRAGGKSGAVKPDFYECRGGGGAWA
jgi:hypothetical protein